MNAYWNISQSMPNKAGNTKPQISTIRHAYSENLMLSYVIIKCLLRWKIQKYLSIKVLKRMSKIFSLCILIFQYNFFKTRRTKNLWNIDFWPIKTFPSYFARYVARNSPTFFYIGGQHEILKYEYSVYNTYEYRDIFHTFFFSI